MKLNVNGLLTIKISCNTYLGPGYQGDLVAWNLCTQFTPLFQNVLSSFMFWIQVTWTVSDSEGERRDKGEETEDGLAVFHLAVGDSEKVK